MKFWKIAKFLLSNKEVRDVFWEIYEALKDGKINKKEMNAIAKELLDVAKQRLGK